MHEAFTPPYYQIAFQVGQGCHSDGEFELQWVWSSVLVGWGVFPTQFSRSVTSDSECAWRHIVGVYFHLFLFWCLFVFLWVFEHI